MIFGEKNETWKEKKRVEDKFKHFERNNLAPWKGTTKIAQFFFF